MIKVYIYQIQAYKYSDFTTWEISHEKEYSEEEFKAILKEAKSKLSEDAHPWNFINNLIAILGQQYGFKKVKYTAVVHTCEL